MRKYFDLDGTELDKKPTSGEFVECRSFTIPTEFKTKTATKIRNKTTSTWYYINLNRRFNPVVQHLIKNGKYVCIPASKIGKTVLSKPPFQKKKKKKTTKKTTQKK